MKKVLKWGFIIIIGIIIVNMVTGGEEEATPTTTDKAAATETKPKEEAKPADKITKENYEAIKTGDSLTGEGGMTIEEVQAMLGEPTDKTESQSGDMKLEMMSWNNGKITKMASISITFTNGKASAKNWLE